MIIIHAVILIFILIFMFAWIKKQDKEQEEFETWLTRNLDLYYNRKDPIHDKHKD